MNQSKAITTTALFFALGQAERLTRDATTKAHKDYTKSTPEQQAQLRHDCLVQFIMGYLSTEDKPFTQKAAERILSQTRDERTKGAQDAYYKGSSKFSYHIIRPTPEAAPATSHARVAVPKVKVEQAVKLFAGMTREQINALVDRALAQITFE